MRELEDFKMQLESWVGCCAFCELMELEVRDHQMERCPRTRALVANGDGHEVGEARNIWEEKDGEVFGVFSLRHTAVIVRGVEDEGRRWRSVRAGIRGLLSVWG